MKNYNVNLINKDKLTLTGKGEDTLWDKADILTDFVSPWVNEKHKKIEFKALWDTTLLFFCFVVYDNKIHINMKDDSIDSIGNSDRVELFFRSDKFLNPYYCLEIDPSTRIMDFKAFPDKIFDFDWNWPKKDITVKSSISNNHFTVEGSISIKSLRRYNLIKDNKIETGIFLAKYKKQEDLCFEPTWISWVNPHTEMPNFHTASSFGVLNLRENKAI